MDACAITDHGSMFGCVEFFKAMKAEGLKPIIGCEVYVAPGSRYVTPTPSDKQKAYHHLILLAKNNEGLTNLNRLVSCGFTEGFYYGKPDASAQIYEGGSGNGEYVYLGTIQKEEDWNGFVQKNKFSVGDEIELIRPDGNDFTVTVKALYNENKESVDCVPHASSKCYVDLGMELKNFDIMRMKQRKETEE